MPQCNLEAACSVCNSATLVDTDNAYKGPSSHFGTPNDPLVGRKVGGVNVFGGGLALYAAGRKIIGGVGLSGDTSCADHFIAWRLRNNLQLDHFAGVFAVSGDTNRPDNIVFDFVPPSGGQTAPAPADSVSQRV
jgi:Haem degrading protein HbpS-like